MRHAFSIIALAVLIVALLPASLLAQQTVDPAGACRTDSQLRIINAPSAIYVCLPNTHGSATGTWTAWAALGAGSTMGSVNVGYTINYTHTALSGAGDTTAVVNLPALPVGATIVGCKIEVMVKPATAGLSGLTISVGDSTSATAYSAAYETFVTVSDTSLGMGTPAYKITGKAAVTPLLTFTPTGGHLHALTAGQWKVTVTYVPAPASFTVLTAN